MTRVQDVIDHVNQLVECERARNRRLDAARRARDVLQPEELRRFFVETLDLLNVFDDDGERGSGQTAPHETQQGADTPDQRASVAVGNVAEPQPAPIGHRSEQPSSSNLLAAALGPELAAMMEQHSSPPSAPSSPPPVVHRDPKPDNAIRGVCSKCKQPGHNARSCGRAPKGPGGVPTAPRIETIPPKVAPDLEPPAIAPRTLKPTQAAIAEAKVRIARRNAAETLARMRAPIATAQLEEPADDNDNADERWSPKRRDDERDLAEGRKHAGELPVPRSTWEF